MPRLTLSWKLDAFTMAALTLATTLALAACGGGTADVEQRLRAL